MDRIKLIEAAKEVQQQAHAPFSGYRVGAALMTEDGKIFSGCNVEVSTYGLTVCAERNAVAAAIAHGERRFKAIAVVTSNGATPCGACRQVLWEICGDIPVILVDESGKTTEIKTSELLPEPFDSSKLG